MRPNRRGRPPHGSDWPQFRFDAGRTAASPHELPETPALHWVRDFGPPRPAFPHDPRRAFDRSYEPVVAGDTLYVPSMVTDSVTALDVATGRERWRFFAEGPIRFAPVVWQDHVYVASDDGFLYCLQARDGRRMWKVQGRPGTEPARRIMGHDRLVSAWPVRGGPVIAEGVLYFAAGLWPDAGIHVHAVDARSGDLLWTNREGDRIPESNWDHGIRSVSGLTPLGYLAVAGDRLIVPCGAQLPAFFDRATGALQFYTMGWGGRETHAKGTWFVAALDRLLVQGGDFYDMTRPYREARAVPSGVYGGRPFYRQWLYPGGWTRLCIDPANRRRLGEFRQPVLTRTAIYESRPDGLLARNPGAIILREHGWSDRRSSHRHDSPYPDPFVVRFPRYWTLPSTQTLQIKAGDRLYSGGPGVVQAVTAGTDPPEIVWHDRIEGTPHRMLAAANRLFVVTREGRIHAFGAAGTDEPFRHPASAPPAGRTGNEEVARASRILDVTGVRDGYALVLGLANGRLVEALLEASDLYVIVLEPDAERVDRFRERLYRMGWYGRRVTVLMGTPRTHPLPPYLANLIVSEVPDALWAHPDVWGRLEGLFRSLRPYGGCAVLGPRFPVEGVSGDATALEGQITFRESAEGILAVRAGPLPGSGGWTHAGADAGNTGASGDTLRKPEAVLGFNPQRYQREPHANQTRVSGGRMFILEMGLLRAVDVYTGRLLWERPAPGAAPDLILDAGERHATILQKHFPKEHQIGPHTQWVAVPDAIYFTDGISGWVMDPATGDNRMRFHLPEERSDPWNHLRVWGDYLIGVSGTHVLALDRHTGKRLWQTGRVSERVREIRLAVGNERVFCAEIANIRRGECETSDGVTRALDIHSGRPLWQRAGGAPLRYSAPLDVWVTPMGIYRGADGALLQRLGDSVETRQTIHTLAWNPAWEVERPGIIAGDRLITGREAHSSHSLMNMHRIPCGEPIVESMRWMRRGCTAFRAGQNLLSTRYYSYLAWMDLDTRDITPFLGVRPACGVNNQVIPAEGVLLMLDFSGGCECNFATMSMVLVPDEAFGTP